MGNFQRPFNTSKQLQHAGSLICRFVVNDVLSIFLLSCRFCFTILMYSTIYRDSTITYIAYVYKFATSNHLTGGNLKMVRQSCHTEFTSASELKRS